MRLMNKQLVKEILKNRIFLILMLLMTAFTSFMYFFVHFSIDGNITWLRSLPVLNKEQLLYQNGLESNIILARVILTAFTIMTGFVFGMFYYRFLQAAGRMLGCLKSLGFRDADFVLLFQKVSWGISLPGAVMGLFGGYFASDILIMSNRQSYLVEGIVKGLHPGTAVIGLFVPGVVFCFVTRLMYHRIQGREAGLLLTGGSGRRESQRTLRFADKLSGYFPEKHRLSVRLALRNPVAVLLVMVSVMVVTAMFLLAYSLNISSGKVVETQTWGHYYRYETCFEQPRTQPGSPGEKGTDYYLTSEGMLKYKGEDVEWILAAGNGNKEVFELLDESGKGIEFPEYGEVVVSSQLEELYGMKPGSEITVRAGGREHTMKVTGAAYNAKQGWIYVSKKELCEMLCLPEASCTRIFSVKEPDYGGSVITGAEKADALERGMVSNRISAVINQAIGCVIGCILLFLALLLNFQSVTRDILILKLLGYGKKEINKTLVDIYKPVLLVSFLLTLLPAAGLCRYILRSLSIQTGDYMMFRTNIFVPAGTLALLYVIYFLVQNSFQIGIAGMIRKEAAADEL